MADLNDIKLSSDDILKKQFRTKVKGYDPDEVDAYLDQVISDYETFEQIIEDLYGKIGNLQGELIQAKKNSSQATQAQATEQEEVRTYTPTTRRSSSAVQNLDENEAANGETSTNMAIIQRISTLERKVYNLEQRVYGLQK